ncbi:DUF3822 family protein [Patiriisocius marinus]|uniref:DUF3822 family protein n=1 Tax=Patiriisocius marinus TaxID=1397112 RepID=A0A5J4J7K3_9FLAO|nr:hypothetical protein ULMA_26050 [Patiriisocius marinus]
MIGHSFLVKDVSLNTVLFSHTATFSNATSPDEALIALTTTIAKFPELQGSFDSVTVVHQNDLITVVPQALFDENEAANYLKFNTKILPTDFIAFDVITNQEIVVVYVPYININNYIFDTYGSFKYYHSSTIAIEDSIKSSSFKKETTVFIDVAKDIFFCTVIFKGKLQLHNVYSYKTSEDFIYYILFCFEQLQLDPNETPIVLSGAISKEVDLFTILFKYIRHITFAELSMLNTISNKAYTYYLLSKATK